MALTTNRGQDLHLESEGSKGFDADKYLSELHNEDGSVLSIEQITARKQAIKINGLCQFAEDGTIIQVVLPESNN